MSKVIELIKTKAVKGDVGIEIEVEGENLKAVDNAVWRSENDGSLRGHFPQTACEYILTKPIPVKDVTVALEGLREELKDAIFAFSYRTSVHVHLNVQQLEFKELLSMMYTYYLLEEPLMNFCGKTRKGNNFCLRLSDAEGVLDFVSSMFEWGADGINNIPGDNARYAAMNVEAIKKYGSVEFRGMEGNMDVNRIQTWCDILVSIREYSKDKDPKAVYEDFMKYGALGFVQKVLDQNALTVHYARMARDVETSFSISIDLPFAYKEAKEIEVKDYWLYNVGDLVKYEEAVLVQRNGGNVEGTQKARVYKVVRKADQPKQAPIEFNDPWPEMQPGVIRGNNADMMIIDELVPQGANVNWAAALERAMPAQAPAPRGIRARRPRGA